MIAGILLIGAVLTACHKKENRDLAAKQQGNSYAAEEAAAGITGRPSCRDRQKNMDQPNPKSISSAEPSVIVTPDHYGKMKGDSMQVSGQDLSDKFYYEEIPEDVKKRITGKSYGEDCDVPYEELRYVKVLYWGFDDEEHEGELIVNKAIAEDMIDIFKELYHQKYPIERMVLVDEYDADDNTSMAADNTSSFNYRKVDGTDHLSLHSYGLAIDINPLYNPYVRGIKDKQIITPENGIKYADRSLDCSYYIRQGDVCYNAFIKRGFTWGGEWKNQKDYQHFQKKPEEDQKLTNR